MQTNRSFKFISNRIKSLETAIFFNDSSRVMKIPASIIKVLEIDNSGNIWFFVNKPYRDISGLDKAFFAQLHFYNKLFNYFIIASGYATITADDDSYDSKNLMIKLSVSHAEYFQTRKKYPDGQISLANKIFSIFQHDFPTNREYGQGSMLKA